MIELYVSQNNNTTSRAYGNWYARVAYKQTLGIDDMAKHMAEHNTPFSKGTIAGILKDFVSCTREQCLNGNTVMIDNLAIFKCSVVANGVSKLYDKQNDVLIRAAIGAATATKTDDEGHTVTVPTGNALKSLKLLAQATGEFTKAELNKDGRLAWTDAAAKQIAAAKAAALAEAEGGNG
ncbi:MAG: hypothetical protein IKO26_08815 [Paludibacteraceae bacterium]|nr:hypothetical protein [Paludibacteraceae bacterium]